MMRLLVAFLFSSVIGASVVRAQEPVEVPDARAKRAQNNVYLVRMAEDPVAGYRGGQGDLRPTRPDRGQKINPNDPDVVRYAAFLDARHADALAQAGGGRKLYDYRYAVNGFAAELTPQQASRLALVPGVISVEADQADPVDTNRTPGFLGLDAPDGLWNQLGGDARAGEDIIVGVLDSGIWPEHPSVSDRTVGGKLAYHQIPGWHGRCVPGEAFNASHCNQKLIGCQYFVEAFGAGNIDESEYLSCRDSDSHGTHTSTTAAGNHGVAAALEGNELGNVSGIAPRARIAMYKVCWRAPGFSALCFGADRAAAIDQAVADGVDVLNHSIGATRTSFLEVVQVAFLFAADAGVFVAASAGNSGPGSATVAGPGPWLTTVAASTHDRAYQASAVLGNGATHNGVSLTKGTGPSPKALIHSSSAGVAGANATEVTLCYPGTLDLAKVAGKIVLCDRGIIARVDKSLAVKQAGGAGMILRNTAAGQGLNADLHHLPSLHVDNVVGAAIKSYIDGAGAGATARLTDGVMTTTAAPFIASFSSRGPLLATGDLLKPDLTAPGVDVLAGTSPVANLGRFYDFFSGTSMSSPHVAGLAALLKQHHPDWTPMMIKSALMTTATSVLGTGSSASPFAQGAGHVTPNKAVDPGLVYDAGFDDWLALLCGSGQLVAPYCPSIAIDPSDLNVASIAIGDLAGVQTITRRVTNVGPPGTYSVSVSAPSGIDVTIDPASLALATGASASYTATFTRTTAAPNAYGFGSLTWTDGIRTARSPIAIRPVLIAAPSRLAFTGASGMSSYNVKFGYSGAFSATPRGLAPAATEVGTVLDDPNDSFNTATPAGNSGITVHTITIPAGTLLARVSLFDAFTDGDDDLDVFVYNTANTLVGASAGATSAEEVNLTNPAPGVYTIYVHGFATDGPDAVYTLFTWSVGPDLGNLTVTAPASATLGATASVTLNWSGLAPATKYLGLVRYASGTEFARTIVTVDVP